MKKGEFFSKEKKNENMYLGKVTCVPFSCVGFSLCILCFFCLPLNQT